MTLKLAQFCDDPTKKISTKSSYPPKIFFFLKTQKNIEIQNFEPQKMGRAYVCVKISEYPPWGRMTVEIISWSISTKVWDWTRIKLATPGSAVRLASVARHLTDCATRPGKYNVIGSPDHHHQFIINRFLLIWRCMGIIHISGPLEVAG